MHICCDSVTSLRTFRNRINFRLRLPTTLRSVPSGYTHPSDLIYRKIASLLGFNHIGSQRMPTITPCSPTSEITFDDEADGKMSTTMSHIADICNVSMDLLFRGPFSQSYFLQWNGFTQSDPLFCVHFHMEEFSGNFSITDRTICSKYTLHQCICQLIY